jgi:phage major head subunit gpT-like protein
MAINTGNFGKALWPGIEAWWGDSYNEFKTEYDAIFETVKSRKSYEENVGFSGLGLPEIRGEGAPVSYDTMMQGFVDRYTHVEYALGFTITKVMVEDDQYDVIAPKKASALAFSARQNKEIVGANILNLGFTGGPVYGDGVSLINAAHPNVFGGTWANQIAVAADLSEAALEQAIIDLGKYTNDRGLRIAVRAKKLVVPVDLDFEAGKIMKTEYEVGTNNNTVNVVRSRIEGGYTVNHYLTDPDAWFIITDVKDGMKYFERTADEFSMDDDFDTDNAKFKFRARYSFGCSDKRSIYGSPGA